MSVGSNFLCGRPHGADPSPVRMRSPEPGYLSPPCGRHKCRAYVNVQLMTISAVVKCNLQL